MSDIASIGSIGSTSSLHPAESLFSSVAGLLAQLPCGLDSHLIPHARAENASLSTYPCSLVLIAFAGGAVTEAARVATPTQLCLRFLHRTRRRLDPQHIWVDVSTYRLYLYCIWMLNRLADL